VGDLRLIGGIGATAVERAVMRDAAALLGRASGRDVGVAATADEPAVGEILVGHAASSAVLRRRADWQCQSEVAGAYRVHRPAGAGIVVAGADAEGARNGLYALLTELGFGFCRDGDRIPQLAGVELPGGRELRAEPAYRWRGESFWDYYPGPRRFCASMWGAAQWERALLYLARNGLNLAEYHPPIHHTLALTFPDVPGLEDGDLWRARAKHDLAKRVVARGRALGIVFKYSLTYGGFSAAVRKHYPKLQWGNGFLCAGQPELAQFTARYWGKLIEELGTDHLYALYYRMEEGQSYSDTCVGLPKHEGFRQAVDVLRKLDPAAVVSVSDWGEKASIFDKLQPDVHACHVRHGMGGLFDDVGRGREQHGKGPAWDARKRWWVPFTVFSAGEMQVQTAWSDAAALVADAEQAREKAVGMVRWAEWSATSPWLCHVVARQGWAASALDVGAELRRYAQLRHGPRAQAYLAGFEPLWAGGNARIAHTPRKRLVVPWYASDGQRAFLARVRAGLKTMAAGLAGPSSPLFDRDLIDLAIWVAWRQAHTLEAAAYAARDPAPLTGALKTWDVLHRLLAQQPERSLLATVRAVAAEAPLSAGAEKWLWWGTNFYHGYALALTPLSVELVYRKQCAALQHRLSRGVTEELPAPKWFWHNLDKAEEAGVRRLPAIDAAEFEKTVKARFTAALAGAGNGEPDWRSWSRNGTAASEPTAVPAAALAAAVSDLLAVSA